MASSTTLKEATRAQRWDSGMIGFLPFFFSTVLSLATTTTSLAPRPPVFLAASRNRTCPKCKRSKTPEARTIFLFSVLSVLLAIRNSLPPTISKLQADLHSKRQKLNLPRISLFPYNILHLRDTLLPTAQPLRLFQIRQSWAF